MSASDVDAALGIEPGVRRPRVQVPAGEGELTALAFTGAPTAGGRERRRHLAQPPELAFWM